MAILEGGFPGTSSRGLMPKVEDIYFGYGRAGEDFWIWREESEMRLSDISEEKISITFYRIKTRGKLYEELLMDEEDFRIRRIN